MAVGGVSFPSNVRLVGVRAVETSEIDTESFRIINCAGEAGEVDRSEVGLTSAIATPAGLVSKDVDEGGIGKSGIADFRGAASGRSLVVPEFFRRGGISPSFQSCDPAAL